MEVDVLEDDDLDMEGAETLIVPTSSAAPSAPTATKGQCPHLTSEYEKL